MNTFKVSDKSQVGINEEGLVGKDLLKSGVTSGRRNLNIPINSDLVKRTEI